MNRSLQTSPASGWTIADGPRAHTAICRTRSLLVPSRKLGNETTAIVSRIPEASKSNDTLIYGAGTLLMMVSVYLWERRATHIADA